VSNLQRFDVRNCGSRLDFDPCACLGYVRRQARTTDWACMNDQLMTASVYVYVSPALYSAVDCRLLCSTGLTMYRPSSRHSRLLIALLLSIGNIEVNPGPQYQTTMNFGLLKCADPCVNFGLLNARSAVHKAALIHDVLSDHHLDLAAVTETWMLSDEPDTVKLDIAPAG